MLQEVVILMKCQSVFKCGEEKLRPGEIDGRGTRCTVKKLKGEIAKVEQDLINKEQSLNKLLYCANVLSSSRY